MRVEQVFHLYQLDFVYPRECRSHLAEGSRTSTTFWLIAVLCCQPVYSLFDLVCHV